MEANQADIQQSTTYYFLQIWMKDDENCWFDESQSSFELFKKKKLKLACLSVFN